MRLEGKRKKKRGWGRGWVGGSKVTCVRQKLSPGQIGEQGSHCNPAARAAPWANGSNQICVIGLRKICEGKKRLLSRRSGHKEAFKNPLSSC